MIQAARIVASVLKRNASNLVKVRRVEVHQDKQLKYTSTLVPEEVLDAITAAGLSVSKMSDVIMHINSGGITESIIVHDNSGFEVTHQFKFACKTSFADFDGPESF